MTENENNTANKTVNIKEELYSLLKQNESFVNSNNELLRDNILLKDNRQTLIELLLSNNNTKEYFFDNVNEILIFKENDFIKYLKQRDYLEDSYTEFDNRIGFNIKRELDKDIVLEFPYKDCILEGGQTKDDKSKRKEIFFNEILAKNEIKRLFEAKVLTNLEICGGGGGRFVALTEIKK